METKFRKSKQRKRILELLQGTDIHPSADWIYERIRKEFKNLSMGTVYRNLSILQEQGYIKKIDFGSTFDRYDANITKHYHFICEKCGSILDVKMPIDESLNKKVNKYGKFFVQHHRIEFFGLCERCME